jgi:AcrR family transcriptional regulator
MASSETPTVKRAGIKPKPKQARAVQRQKAILAAAFTLLETGKVDAITTTAIAEKAQIPVGSVYQYFKNRTDILDQLYHTAYTDIEKLMMKEVATLPEHGDFAATSRFLLHAFWREARRHPHYRQLTRWSNSHYAMWDITPGIDSNLSAMIEETLERADVALDTERKQAGMRTVVSATSVLIDQAIEERDENQALALIDELAALLNAYVRNLTQKRL